MRRAVAVAETCVEKHVEAWEKDIKRLVQDAVDDPVRAGGLVRRGSAYRSLNLWNSDVRAFGPRVCVSLNIREVRLERGREKGLP